MVHLRLFMLMFLASHADVLRREDPPNLVCACYGQSLQRPILLPFGSHHKPVQAEAYIHPASALDVLAGKPCEERFDFYLAYGV